MSNTYVNIDHNLDNHTGHNLLGTNSSPQKKKFNKISRTIRCRLWRPTILFNFEEIQDLQDTLSRESSSLQQYGRETVFQADMFCRQNELHWRTKNKLNQWSTYSEKSAKSSDLRFFHRFTLLSHLPGCATKIPPTIIRKSGRHIEPVAFGHLVKRKVRIKQHSLDTLLTELTQPFRHRNVKLLLEALAKNRARHTASTRQLFAGSISRYLMLQGLQPFSEFERIEIREQPSERTEILVCKKC